MNREYKEPAFKVVAFETQDILTASTGIEETPPHSTYTPGHYDTPIIRM